MENKAGNITSGENISYWIDSVAPLKYEKLNQDLETEVLVIGGGISGLTSAYMLLKAGKKVVLIEDGFLGSGETGRTTAHLSCALDDRYYYLEEVFGKTDAALAGQSHMAAIKAIENIVHLENIDCSFKNVNGYLFLHPSDKPENLEKEYLATKNAGLITTMVNGIPGIAHGSKEKCILFPYQAQFHVLRYLDGLAKAITEMGGQIFTETKGDNINSSGATANGFSINAKHIIVATNSPVNDLFTMHTKQFPYRTYVIAAKVKKGKLPYALWWDTGDANSKWVSEPYHYVRVEPYDGHYDLLISGGEDHKTGQADAEDIPESQRYGKLEKWTRMHFPDMGAIDYFWSGQVMEPLDSLGFMGKNPGDDNIYIITGDSGHGMTHATIGAMIIKDLILGIENPWEKLYSPSRVTFRTAGDFVKEAGNMASQYLDWIKPSDVKAADDLKPGDGGILTSGLKKLAVYRDESNILHAYTAVCPHLGCIVQWNGDEKSFDCPCHGSRFTHEGIVVNGPATADLKKLTIKD